jgi:hypothetical protein
MAKSALSKHKASDMVKWVIVFLLIIGLVATTVTLFVKLDRQTTVTEIGAEAYTIATLDDSGKQTDGDTSIVTRNAFTTDGLKVEIADGATVTYTLYFYGAKDEFISKTESLSKDFDGTIPENAETAKIVITPTDDEDGKVDLTEILGYAGQVTVTVNR